MLPAANPQTHAESSYTPHDLSMALIQELFIYLFFFIRCIFIYKLDKHRYTDSKHSPKDFFIYLDTTVLYFYYFQIACIFHVDKHN